MILTGRTHYFEYKPLPGRMEVTAGQLVAPSSNRIPLQLTQSSLSSLFILLLLLAGQLLVQLWKPPSPHHIILKAPRA